MIVTGTADEVTSRGLSDDEPWGEVHRISDVPALVDEGRIPPNGNVTIIAHLRDEGPTADGASMRATLYRSLEEQAEGQIRFDGSLDDSDWLHGDTWVVEMPARRVEQLWPILRGFSVSGELEAEISPPVQDYSEPEEPEPARAGSMYLVGGALAASAGAVWWFTREG